MRISNYLTRRQLAYCVGLTGVLGLLFAVEGNAQRVRGQTLEITLMPPDSADAAYYSSGAPTNRSFLHFEQGVQLGVEEADRTGRLLGWRVTLRTHPIPVAPLLVSFSASELSVKAGSLLLTAYGSNKAKACSDRRFLITNALAGKAALWDSTSERFGAAQLNDRYRARFREGMDSDAWAGWVAVKVLSEAAFRAGSSRTDAILRYFVDQETRFDGHKGVPLHFGTNHIMLPDSAASEARAACR